MSGLPRRARIYLLCVCANAAAALAGSLSWLVNAGGSESLPHWSRPELAAVLGQLAVLSVVAQHFPLTLGPRRKQDLTQMVHLAILLLAGTPLAVVLVGRSEERRVGKECGARWLRERHEQNYNNGPD